MQSSNGSSLADIQNEVSDGANLTQIIGNLTQMIARDLQRARNTRVTEGANEGEVRSRDGKSHSPLRSALKSSAQPPVRRDLSESFARNGNNEKIEQLQRQLMEQQTANERLQHECDTMVANYSRKIDAQEDTIRSLNMRLEHQGNLASTDPDYEGLMRRENDALKRENELMRDKITELSNGMPPSDSALEAECRRLRGDLQEKERELLKQGDQLRQLIGEKDNL